MAFTQFSNGSPLTFGFDDANASSLASTIGMRPQTLSISATPEFEAEGKNEDGETISYVRGADKYAFDMSGYLENETLFASVRSFTFHVDGSDRLFIVGSRKTDKSSQDFQKISIQGVCFPNVTEQD